MMTRRNLLGGLCRPPEFARVVPGQVADVMGPLIPTRQNCTVVTLKHRQGSNYGTALLDVHSRPILRQVQ